MRESEIWFTNITLPLPSMFTCVLLALTWTLVAMVSHRGGMSSRVGPVEGEEAIGAAYLREKVTKLRDRSSQLGLHEK